jgi:hypothetical protein
MPIDPLTALLKGLELLKAGLSGARKQLGKRKADQLASGVIAELLKQSPDFTAAEARLAAIEATGAAPTIDIQRAKNMYRTACAHRAGVAKTRKAARRRHTMPASKRKPAGHRVKSRKRRKT